jgi:hypothetical protein
VTGQVSLNALRADPAKVDNLPVDMAADLTIEIAGLLERLRLRALAARGGAHPSLEARTEDDLLTAEEAAPLLKTTPTWLLRHHKTLPFARKLSPKMVRFSKRGLLHWAETRGR